MKVKKKSGIAAYLVALKIEKMDDGYFCVTSPGIGGVYEEAKTKTRAVKLALESVGAILNAREANGEAILEDNEYLTIIRHEDTPAPQRVNVTKEMLSSAPSVKNNLYYIPSSDCYANTAAS